MGNIIVQSILPTTFEAALEYGELSMKTNLTTVEEERMAEILQWAAQDSTLDFLLNEIDHLLGHSMGFLSLEARNSYRNQQALLREYLGENIAQGPISGEPSPSSSRSGKTPHHC